MPEVRPCCLFFRLGCSGYETGFALQAALAPVVNGSVPALVERPEGDFGHMDRLSSQQDKTYECKALGGFVKHLAGPLLPADHRALSQPALSLSAIKGPGLV